jgi:DNA topoisomerase-1
MGEFLACENFPDCKHTQNFTKDENGVIIPVDQAAEEESGEICEKCGKPLLYKHGRFGKFLACSGYPECKHIRAQSTGVACPEEGCSGELVQKISKRGKVFYGCNNYPKCTYALWDKPVAEKCPLCNSPFLVITQKKNTAPRLRCPNKSCTYSAAQEENENRS